MSGLEGAPMSLLDGRHYDGCEGAVYSACRLVSFGDGFVVLFTEWCGECGAADYEVVGEEVFMS